ncbi:Hypothetical predicted protein [Lecanosticta acicola]|uniref:Rhodopsin domain-containing protein n=1 Tax=Lecanosticta acicola TaxID=111012 RepID=A0AAI8YSA1_9PEZI|nr:Hypothetical predicted protein [Lecanosticta acicola]
MTYVNRASVMGIGVTFIVTSLVAVALRFAMRVRNKMGLGVDDWLSLAAMILVLAACSVFVAGSATATFGTHSPDIGMAIYTYENPKQELQKKLEYAFYALMVPGMAFLKLSVLFFYRRIFKISRIFTVCFWILTVTTVLWGISFFIAWLARCGDHPDNGYISLETLTTKCINSFYVLVTQSVFDVAVDIGILVLPIPFILQLETATRQKFAVLAVMLVGSLSMGCGIARMVIVAWILGTPLLTEAKLAGLPSSDFMGIVSLMVFWGMLELGVGMIAICLPTLRPLLKGANVQYMMYSLRSLISLNGGAGREGSRSDGSFRKESEDSEQGRAIEKHFEYSVTSTTSIAS